MVDPRMRRIPWARVFTEGLVIVASILLALAIDALWDRRNDRLEEQRILSALARDFEETRVNVLETMTSTEAVRDTIMKLLELSSSDALEVSPPEVNRLIAGSFWWHFFEPRTSTYQDLVTSGNLRLIRSDSLRTAMALLYEDLGDADKMVDLITTRWVTLEEPFLIQSFVVGEIYQSYRGLTFPALRFASDMAGLRSREFANILAGRVTYLQDVIGAGEDVLDDLDIVQALIERERVSR